MHRHGYLCDVLAKSGRAAFAMLRSVLLCLIIGVIPLTAGAETDTAVTEQQIKAAMLYKFLGYIEWPPQSFATPISPFRIWVLDGEDIKNELQAITEGRKVNHRPIDVFTAKTTRGIIDPHLVFVGRRAERYLPALHRLAQHNSFVIITENQQGLADGSTINLRVIEGRIGFDVSLINAHKQNLKLSARLLSVASTVEQDKH
jgi:hypothetical protein